MQEEICEECFRIIGLDEQAYACQSRIVCEQCDNKLRQAPPQDEGLPEAKEPEEPKQFKEDLEDTAVPGPLVTHEPEEFTGLPENEILPEPQELEEQKEPEQVPESREPEETPEVQESEKSFEPPVTQKPEELLGFREREEVEEPKEPEQVPESREPEVIPEDLESEKAFKILETRKPAEFSEYHEFGDFQEPKEDPEVSSSEKPFESPVTQKPEELLGFPHREGAREPEELQEGKKLFQILAGEEPEEPKGYKKPEKLRDLIEPPAAPFVAEQAASVHSPCKRKRIKRTKSTLLCLLLAAWSVLCLLSVFYVPGRYAHLLDDSAFFNKYQLGPVGADCLILSLLIAWFLGALALFVIATGLQKDRHRARSRSY